MKHSQKRRAPIKASGKRRPAQQQQRLVASARQNSANSRAERLAAARGLAPPPPAAPEPRERDLAKLSKQAERRRRMFERRAAADHPSAPASADDANAPSLPMHGGSQRSFHKELDRVVAMADVLLEVVDARDPLGCRCAALEATALEQRVPKRIVIVLNKADLVPAENREGWVRYLRRFHPTIAFSASSSGAKRAAGSSAEGGGGAPGTAPAGVHSVDALIGLLKSYSRSDKITTAITVGVVGYPNVGKSSVINALKRAKAVTTGATPGVTRRVQVVALDRKVKLVDSPGIVFSKPRSAEEEAEMVLRNVLPVETPIDPLVTMGVLLRRCSAECVREHFEVGPFAEPGELLALIAFKRGLLRKGGSIDQELAARVVLREWCSGALPYFSKVPLAAESADDGAAILTDLAPAFDPDALAQPPAVQPRPSALPAGGGAGAVGQRPEGDTATSGSSDGGSDADEDGPEPLEDDVGARALLQGMQAGSGRRAVAAKPAAHAREPIARRKVGLGPRGVGATPRAHTHGASRHALTPPCCPRAHPDGSTPRLAALTQHESALETYAVPVSLRKQQKLKRKAEARRLKLGSGAGGTAAAAGGGGLPDDDVVIA